MADRGDNTLAAMRAAQLGVIGRMAKPAEPAVEEAEEVGCPGFGYLRGVRDRATTLELRFRTGDVLALPYSWLGPARFNPSVGLLLKFAGDCVSLVLIRGSNLHSLLADRPVNLTDRGIFRHRITWVREMDEDEVRRLPEGEPTIDRIEIVECAEAEDEKSWMRTHAPEFLVR